jgi:quercetin dioxygenase-like cupin family protein
LLEFPSSAGQVTALLLELAQGGHAGKVTFLVPTMLYVVEGAVDVEIQGEALRALTAGQALAAPMNTPVAALNRGTAPAKVLEVFYGDARKPHQSPLQSSDAVGLRTTLVLQTTKTWTGEDIVFPPRANQFIALLVDFAPGAVNPRHVHPHTQFAYGLEGDTTVESDGVPAQTFGPGQAFVETLKPHVGANRGTTKGSVFTIFVGEAGIPTTVRMPQP